MGEPYRVNADGTLTALQVEETGEYLQADSMTGKPLNQQRYQDYKLCKSGLFPVKVDGLWGYVDEDGEMQIHCKYENVQMCIRDSACCYNRHSCVIFPQNFCGFCC